MSKMRLTVSTLVFVINFSLAFLLTGAVSAQVRLELKVDSIVTTVGNDIELPIYISNPLDSIAGFQIWLQIDRPDFMKFTGVVETAGTVIDGWSVGTNSLGGNYLDLLITAFAPIPFTTHSIPPNPGQAILIKPLLEVFVLPDTMIDRTALVHLNDEFLNNFSFSDPSGSSIGIITVSVIDTSWFVCNAWSGPDCLDWEQVFGPPADSTDIDTILVGLLDTSAVHVTDGSVSLAPLYMCGDIDTNGDFDIIDLIYLVDFLFRDGPAVTYWQSADCDGGGDLSVLDIICIACYLFQGCPEPVCITP